MRATNAGTQEHLLPAPVYEALQRAHLAAIGDDDVPAALAAFLGEAMPLVGATAAAIHVGAGDASRLVAAWGAGADGLTAGDAPSPGVVRLAIGDASAPLGVFVVAIGAAAAADRRAELLAVAAALPAWLRLAAAAAARQDYLRRVADREDRYRSLVEVCNDLMQSVDAQGTILFVNPAWLRTLGRRADDVIGRSIFEFLHEDCISHCQMAMMQVFQGNELHGIDVSFRHADGRKITVTGDVMPRFVDGVVANTQGFFRDLSAKRAAEAELQAKTAFLDQVVEAAPEAILFLGIDGRVLRINAEFTRLFGYASAEAVGRHIDQLVVPEGMRAEGADLCRRAGLQETISIDTIRHRKDGTMVEVSLLATPIVVGGEQVAILGIYRDVSDRKRMQAQLARSQRMEAIGRLAGGIAHDFNNLLTVIHAAGDQLLLQVGGDELAKADVEEILAASGKAAGLTKQLIAFSRKQVLQPVALDVNHVVREVSRMLRRVIGESVQIDLELAPDLSRVLADPAQMEQVLMNLAINARDAMPGGGRLAVRTRDVALAGSAAAVVSLPPGPYVELVVADTGCGIEPSQIERIFEPFWSTKAAEGRGAGLGLATVYGIVQQSRGAISVHSQLGVGTRFTLYLPKAAAAAQVASSPAQAPRSRATECILVVEDDDSIRWLVERALRNAGYRVHVAPNAASALALHGQMKEEVELLFTDVVMPGTNGPDLAKRLRETQPDLKVLFTSGYANDRAFDSAALPPRTFFLPKPYSVAALTDRIRSVLDS